MNAELLNVMVPELKLLLPELDERGRRLAMGAVARAAGEGGIGAVARMTGASWQTVADGAAGLASGDTAAPGRVRRPGDTRDDRGTDPAANPAGGILAFHLVIIPASGFRLAQPRVRCGLTASGTVAVPGNSCHRS